MNRFGPRLLLLATLLTTPLAAQRVIATTGHAAVAHERLADTDGDGVQELLLLCAQRSEAELLRYAVAAGEPGLRQRGRIPLPDPTHTLLAVADLLPGPGEEVVVADPSGTWCAGWTLEGAPPGERHSLARRARCTLRVDRPQPAPFVFDLNHDGRPDLLLPGLRSVQPFLQEAPAVDGAADGATNGTPTFRAMAPVPVPVSVTVDTGSRGLDSELVGRLTVPMVQTEDLDGDGRPDLLTREGTRHAFHLQRADGTFAEPVTLDLEQFVDSTPEATIAPGSTIVLGNRQQLQRGDIDGDGIPDYVIAHRRKIWTFVADRSGPQFQKARTQAVADDVTGMLLVDIDEDGRSDLLTFRVQVPGIGSLLLALVRSLDIDVRAVGYRSEADGFAGKPEWRRTITLRVPPILSLLSQQDELVKRFTDVIQKARIHARGRFRDGATTDLVVVKEDLRAIELFTDVGDEPRMATREGQRMMRRLLFEDEDTVFDLERMFGLVSGFLATMAERDVGARAPAAEMALRDPGQWRLADLLVGELDGAPGEELVVVYHAYGDPELRSYDVLSWRDAGR